LSSQVLGFHLLRQGCLRTLVLPRNQLEYLRQSINLARLTFEHMHRYLGTLAVRKPAAIRSRTFPGQTFGSRLAWPPSASGAVIDTRHHSSLCRSGARGISRVPDMPIRSGLESRLASVHARYKFMGNGVPAHPVLRRKRSRLNPHFSFLFLSCRCVSPTQTPCAESFESLMPETAPAVM